MAKTQEKPVNPWDEIKYFKPNDFKCPCGKCNGGRIAIDVVQKLDYMREVVGFPFKVLKGSSCRELHTNAAHVPDSKTGLSYAVDILCPDYGFRFRFLKAAFEAGFKRIELGRDYIHVDNHPDLPEQKCWIRY